MAPADCTAYTAPRCHRGKCHQIEVCSYAIPRILRSTAHCGIPFAAVWSIRSCRVAAKPTFPPLHCFSRQPLRRRHARSAAHPYPSASHQAKWLDVALGEHAACRIRHFGAAARAGCSGVPAAADSRRSGCRVGRCHHVSRCFVSRVSTHFLDCFVKSSRCSDRGDGNTPIGSIGRSPTGSGQISTSRVLETRIRILRLNVARVHVSGRKRTVFDAKMVQEDAFRCSPWRSPPRMRLSDCRGSSVPMTVTAMPARLTSNARRGRT